jgi:hypothetical protein
MYIYICMYICIKSFSARNLPPIIDANTTMKMNIVRDAMDDKIVSFGFKSNES